MARDFKKEIEVINKISESLDRLNEEERRIVIEYFAGRSVAPRATLGTLMTDAGASSHHTPATESGIGLPSIKADMDIRSLKDIKSPSTAIEMAVLVAFYLSELAPTENRKTVIEAGDITNYFKQAGFPLPQNPKMTLPHAKDAGYFDATSVRGQYKLNPVGYNLAVHTMPLAASRKGHKKVGKRTSKRKK
jgi:hypothetical protein